MMMPTLGKYAFTVLSAYGATLLLLAVLIGGMLWRGHLVRTRLALEEARTKERTHG